MRWMLLLGMLLVSGCSYNMNVSFNLSESGEIAKSHLKEMGYSIVSFEEEGNIEFKRNEIDIMPHDQMLSVQPGNIDDYLDKEITTVRFFVSGHPLDDHYNKGKSNVTVFLVDNKVIGGWSFPHSNEPLSGAPYSLDGKTREEIHGSNDQWLAKKENALKLQPVKVEKRTDAGYETVKIVEAATELKRLEDFFAERFGDNNIKVQMVREPDYRFRMHGSTYALWVTPLGDGLEVVVEGEAKYAKLSEASAAELFPIITGEQFISE